MMYQAAAQVDEKPHPEEYCYYGVKGNPVLTKQLKQLEQRVLQSIPRPVLLAHFFTETIGVGQDGPATLYLDTVNENQNYWGSSIYATHQDVKASATANNEPIAAS
eukprot:13219893-Ditylum_brightwellii.AAC.1